MPVRERPKPGEARQRLLATALDLFAQHGVDGTSLQMIADELGVTKAAVYHQFHAKDDILLALVQPLREQLSAVIDEAEGKRGRAAQLDATLVGLVELVISNRHLAALSQADPVVVRLLKSGPDGERLAERVGALLAGPDPDPETLVSVAMVGGGLMLAGHDAMLAGVDDDTLRRCLLTSARRVLKVRVRQ